MDLQGQRGLENEKKDKSRRKGRETGRLMNMASRKWRTE